jgi:hypothetical protein
MLFSLAAKHRRESYAEVTIKRCGAFGNSMSLLSPNPA